jgi:hypothetical protein
MPPQKGRSPMRSTIKTGPRTTQLAKARYAARGLISKSAVKKELVRRGLLSPSQDSEDQQAANRTDPGTPPGSNSL